MILKKMIGMAAMVTLTVLLSACNLGATPAPTQDVGMIYTQAAQLVATQFAMQQTQTALAVPPAALPSPTAQAALSTFPVATPFGASTPFGGSTPFGAGTPFGVATQPGGFLPTTTIMALATAPGQQCDSAVLIADITIPDDTVLKPGKDFRKIWKIQNTGTCNWDEGYEFVYMGGSLDGYNIYFNTAGNYVKAGAAVDLAVDLTASLVPNTYQECWSMKNDRNQYFANSPVACVRIIVEK